MTSEALQTPYFVRLYLYINIDKTHFDVVYFSFSIHPNAISRLITRNINIISPNINLINSKFQIFISK